MRALPILLTACLAASIGGSAQAIQIDFLEREIGYTGGLAQPNMMADGHTSAATGLFSDAFTDGLSDPGVAASGIEVSQISAVDLDTGSLVIQVTSTIDNHADAFASTAVAGAIADAIAWSQLYVDFTTTEDMWLSVDVVVSSSLGVFYDGPGAGVVEASYIGSFLLCVTGDGCLADVLVEDLTDNGMALASGVQDIVLLPAGQYSMELLAVAQTVSRDVGSASGTAAFTGTIRVDPLPEPGGAAGLVAGVALLGALGRSHTARAVSSSGPA